MYMHGFGNYHQTEAVPGALPTNQNSPQQCSLGLYAEQINGTSFTRPRHLNIHSWLYRILPSVVQGDASLYDNQWVDLCHPDQPPNPWRWSPFIAQIQGKDFIDGIFHISKTPHLNAYLYACDQSMEERYFVNHDGELLFVPFHGEINLHTEMGILNIFPGMIAVIPRGIKFSMELLNTSAKGYLCENSGAPLTLPQLGPIGANGLANPRHFKYPVAAYEDSEARDVLLISKFQQRIWQTSMRHSPLNVVAWHGNYAPYCYDLSLFNTINTVSFDHPDPSIFTVLTSESDTPGIANLDFVIFPPRWMVAEHTFRPPYYHRNYMNEFMGLIEGDYDAKKEGFSVGGVSIHNCMIGHGPDADSYAAATRRTLQPETYLNTLAFMFESRDVWEVTEQAMSRPERQSNYSHCWQSLKAEFKG